MRNRSQVFSIRWLRGLSCIAALSLPWTAAGCGESPSDTSYPILDAAGEATADATADTSIDTTTDTKPGDSSIDTAADSKPADSSVDTAADTKLADSSVDTAADTKPADSSVDAAVDGKADALADTSVDTTTDAGAPMKVVAYVPNWIDLNSFSTSVDYSKLTHINIAFENPTDQTGALSFNAANVALISKAHANNVKVLVSLGGGSASEDSTLRNRYFTLISDSKRAGFIQKISAYSSSHGFDGVDIDLEGPAINSDYGKFITDLVSALRPQGRLVTAALSQGYGGPSVDTSTVSLFDFVNIMAYDASGPWDPASPGQHSSYDFAVSNLKYWEGRGLAKSKAVLGVPFYGWGFGAAFRDSEYSYAELVGAYPGAENKDLVGNTIYYNGIPTIKSKTALAMQQAGGVMIWQLASDVAGAKSLLLAIDQVVKTGK